MAFAWARMPLQFVTGILICHQAKRMDVVWGETAGVEGQLLLLCPLLFLLQVCFLIMTS